MGKIRKRYVGEVVRYRDHAGLFEITQISGSGDEREYVLKVLEKYKFPAGPGYAVIGETVYGAHEGMVPKLKYILENL